MITAFLNHLAHTRRLSPGTIRLRRIYLTQLAQSHDLASITDAELAAWLDRPDRWSPETTNVATATVRTFYQWAHQTGRIDHNPAAYLARVRVPPKRRRVATAAQIEAGLATKTPTIRAITLLGAECGLRVHEIAKLHQDDVNGEWITIVGKGGQQRTVHASPELRDELAGLDTTNGWFFPSRAGGHTSASVIRERIRRALGTNPHSLRHRAGTTVYRGTGNNLRVTQVFLGHRNPATTAIYVDVNEDDLRAASAAARINA